MPPTDIRAVIEHARGEMPIRELARRANVSFSALHGYLAGKRECRSDVLERLLASLDIRLLLPK